MKKYIVSAVVAVGMISLPTAADAAFSESYQVTNGDVGEDVNELQVTLKELGYFNGSTGNTFGPRTLSAVQDFQLDNGVSSPAGNFYGVAGPETQEVLNNITSSDSNGSTDGNNETTEDEGTEEEAVTEENTGNEGTEEPATEEDTATEENEGTEENTGSEDSTEAEGNSFTMDATAYTADCEGCTGVTATGKDLNNDPDANVVAVDPDVIPLGSTVHVEGYGEAVAADTGGAINGEKIDLHVSTKEEANNFGQQSVEVTVLD
ncbi:peptidoglycan-binding protein [Salicibibacter cibi]|uniref:Peptidoglycan-binding protein n=1 Tax=Salicibibacter cibi TaxID=2743001 RepID=A0A7T6ZCE2_9BACI|nr:3D domain-containing protein [Salicibibacter cibi]QQK80742.1 peptidoglycan-binding protein [Salicibibacter cibi]